MDFIAPIIKTMVLSLLAPLKIIKHPVKSSPYIIIDCIILLIMYNRVKNHIPVDCIDVGCFCGFFIVLAKTNDIS